MAKLTSDFRLLAIREKDPEKLIGRVNDRVCAQSCRGMFVTLQYIVFGKRQLEANYINAWHLPPILWNRAEGKFMLLLGGGPPVGVLPGRQFPAAPIPFKPGDCILLATDGLIEAKNARDELFGWQRLEEAVRSGDSDVESIKTRVSRAIEDFVKDRPQADDTTMVVIGVEEGDWLLRN